VGNQRWNLKQKLINTREENNFFSRHFRLIAEENGRDQGGE
jgi:hypothetical protein